MTNAEWAVQGARIGPLRHEGQSLRAIVRETGISRNTVRKRLKKEGAGCRVQGAGCREGQEREEAEAQPTPPLSSPPCTPAPCTLLARMIHLHVEEGLNARQVALRLGLKREGVRSRLKQAGVYRPQPAGKPLPPLPAAMLPHVPHALNLARKTLERVTPPLTPENTADDWEAIARFAALRGLATYRPDRACDWKSWVIQKVRWEIVEELRRTSLYTRDEWREIREAEWAIDPGLGTPQRRGEWEQREMQLIAARRPASLEQLREETTDNEGLMALRQPWEPSWAPTPEEWLLAGAVRDAVAALPARLRFVVQCFEQGYADREIASALSLSQSRIHQLHEEGRERLREALAEWA